jgi:hypothetical protein
VRLAGYLEGFGVEGRVSKVTVGIEMKMKNKNFV